MLRLSALVFLASLPAFAADSVVIDTADEGEEAPSRCAPAIACSAKLASSALVSVEAGSDGRTGDGEFIHAGQMVIRYTLSPRVEFDIYSDTLILAGAQPRESIAVQPGIKVSLLAEGDLFPSVDVSAHLTMPTYDPSSTWNVEGWLYFSKTFGDLKADLNLMAAMVDVPGEATTQGLGTLTVTADLGHGLNLFGEAYATWGSPGALPAGGGLFSGVSVALSDEFIVDVGAELAWHDAPVMTAFAGLTFVPQGHAPRAHAPVASLQHLAN